jgi:hypothetical protein
MRPFNRLLFVYLASAALAIGCSSPSNDLQQFSAFKDPADAPAPIRTAARAVVRIATAAALGTGSFISVDGVLLTNNHVLGIPVCPREGCYATIARAHERNGSHASETVFLVPLNVNAGLDMAVLQAYSVDGPGQHTRKLVTPDFLSFLPRDARALVDSQVYIVGHPEGTLKKWTTGQAIDSSGTWFWSTAFVLPGNSGSPILNDAGQIVGLLHRGPTSEDLITHNGVNEYSIGTASGALVAAMKDPLPPTVLSVLAASTDADVLDHQLVYLNAQVSTANVNNSAKPILSILADACDKALARTDYVSPEDLSAALSPCDDAAGWIECRSDLGAGVGGCPTPSESALWRGRWQAEVDHWRAFNGELVLSADTFGRARLEQSELAGRQAGATALQQVLATAGPPLDFSLAYYLAAFGVDAYGGQQASSYVMGYASVPHYEVSIPTIVSAATWLAHWGTISRDDLRTLMAQLFNEDKASLGARLHIEDVQFNWKLNALDPAGAGL